MPSNSRSRDRRRGVDHGTDDDDIEFNPTIDRRQYRREKYYEDRASPRRYHEEESGDYDSPDTTRRRERYGSKAKESPATSPIKRSHRDRDRDGQTRRDRRRGPGDDGSPAPGVRERRHRRDRDGHRHRDEDDEARRQRRRERRRAREREMGHERERDRERTSRKHAHAHSKTDSGSHLLSADSLARLESQYADEDEGVGLETAPEETEAEMARRENRRRRRRQRKEAALLGGGEGEDEEGDIEERTRVLDEFSHSSPKVTARGRVVSGPFLEEGRSDNTRVRHRGGGGSETDLGWKEGDWDDGSGSGSGDGDHRPFWKKKKWWWIGLGVLVVLLAIIIPVVIVVSKKKHSTAKDGDGDSGSSGSTPYNSNLDGLDPDSIPKSARGTILDPWTWYDTTDFNVTYTNETVGGLSIMGLNSTWDDSARPNENVPPLNEKFPYGSQPIRGVNLGGWLSIEPFIVPSLFNQYSASDNVLDEWTLSQKLGSSAASTIEKHYATFIREEDFADIQNAGLDHVRIQYSYWAVKTYDGDPYVAKTSWRYLLRAIEYCRKYGLRVKLDLHGIPGSQNGWNHSGHQGRIGWLNGTDGDLNRQRSLEIHDQLSKFFAQDRYKNVITIYGLVNEPLMLALPVEPVLNWTTQVAELVQKNGITARIAFHDGFLPLNKWDSMLKDAPPNMMLDTHQYTIFNTGEIVLNHTAKIELICNAWYPMIQEINTTTSGWGPTMCGEWSQADTDCTEYLNDVGKGTRWEGTLSNTTPYCPVANSKFGGRCSCTNANADPSTYSDDYKKWLLTYAEAQMSVFETAQGWFYWTWQTESAAQWSYKTAWKNGFMPAKAYRRDFKCGDPVPDFGSLPEYY